MKKFALIAAALAAFALAPTGAGAKVTEEEIARIDALLAEMKCEMDPDDIEKEDDGYELDDVICEGGQQFDIELNAAFEVVEKRAE